MKPGDETWETTQDWGNLLKLSLLLSSKYTKHSFHSPDSTWYFYELISTIMPLFLSFKFWRTDSSWPTSSMTLDRYYVQRRSQTVQAIKNMLIQEHTLCFLFLSYFLYMPSTCDSMYSPQPHLSKYPKLLILPRLHTNTTSSLKFFLTSQLKVIAPSSELP